MLSKCNTNNYNRRAKNKKSNRKTGRLHQFKIGKVAIDILNKYIKEDAQPDDYIFPIITDKKSYNKSEEIRYFISQREKFCKFPTQPNG
jgi:integrase/recombinase XerD